MTTTNTALADGERCPSCGHIIPPRQSCCDEGCFCCPVRTPGLFDPRDFTPAEWDIIIRAFRFRGERLRRYAGRLPSAHERESAALAEARHFDLAHRALAAKIFCKTGEGR